MPYGTLDIGYRAPGKTVPILLNPREPRELDEFVRDTRPVLRFSLNAAGFIWFGRAMDTLYGDEFQGRVIIDKKWEKAGLRDSLEAPRLLSGVLFTDRSGWKARLFEELAWDPWRGNEPRPYHERHCLSERAVLTAFNCWHQATQDIDILWINGMSYEEQLEHVKAEDLD